MYTSNVLNHCSFPNVSVHSLSHVEGSCVPNKITHCFFPCLLSMPASFACFLRVISFRVSFPCFLSAPVIAFSSQNRRKRVEKHKLPVKETRQRKKGEGSRERKQGKETGKGNRERKHTKKTGKVGMQVMETGKGSREWI
jgi:hypothetical protein